VGLVRRIQSILERKDRILKGDRGVIPAGLPDDTHGSAFRTAAIAEFVNDSIEVFKDRYSEIMVGTYQGELIKDSQSRGVIDFLKKEIGRKRIYSTPETLKLELMGRKIIRDLLELFWEGAQKIGEKGDISSRGFGAKIANLLSNNYRKVFVYSRAHFPNFPVSYHRLQLVTDYVCGMTDSFAQSLHAELWNG
jgi:dGTPase